MQREQIENLEYIKTASLLGMWKIETDPIAKIKFIKNIIGETKITKLEVKKVLHSTKDATMHKFVFLFNGVARKISTLKSRAKGKEVGTRAMEQYLDMMSAINFCVSNKKQRKTLKNLEINTSLSIPLIEEKSIREFRTYEFLTSWIGKRNLKHSHLASTLLALGLVWKTRENKESVPEDFLILEARKKMGKLFSKDFIGKFSSTMSVKKFNAEKSDILRALEYFEKYENSNTNVETKDIIKLINSYRSKARGTVLTAHRRGMVNDVKNHPFSSVNPAYCDAAHIVSVSRIKKEIIDLVYSGKNISSVEVQEKLSLINDEKNLLLLPHPIHYFFDLGFYNIEESELKISDSDYEHVLSAFNLPKNIELMRR